MLHVCLVTRGSPDSVSGGFLYHRRLQAVAHEHEAVITFGQASGRWTPDVRTDVVVVDSIAAWRMLPAVLREGRRRPFVAMVHQHPGGTDGSAAWRAVRRRLDVAVYRRCRAVMAASSTLGASLVASHGIAPGRLTVVEPGCDLPPGSPPDDLRAGRRAAVLCVANWFPNKGVLELLDAVAALAPDDVTLHLAGRDDVDAAYGQRVWARLAAADLAGRVVVHGAVDRQTIADLYAGADVFALATYVEAYATVFAEALAAGLPIVGWRRPFLEDFVRDGVEGRLVDSGDVAALTDALAGLARDDVQRRRCAGAAAQRGTLLPTWQDTAAGFFAVLQQVAGDEASSRSRTTT